MRKILIKILKSLVYILFKLTLGPKYVKFNDRIAEKFVELNNKFVLSEIKKIENDKILILLPHCIQLYDCIYKVTGDIMNCKKCGKCVVHSFVNIKEKYNVEVKIATGGTLARKYIKEIRPTLIIAVACKRDLITGIVDSDPFLVYGIFNIIKGEPCINTTVSSDEINRIFRQEQLK